MKTAQAQKIASLEAEVRMLKMQLGAASGEAPAHPAPDPLTPRRVPEDDVPEPQPSP